MSKMHVAVGVLGMAILASCTKDVKEQNSPMPELKATQETLSSFSGRQPGQSFMPNEVLIKFKKGTSETGRAHALARISGKVQEKILTKAMERLGDEAVYLVNTPLAALDAVIKAKGLEVEYAEPNYIYTLDATSSDTYYANGSLWGMYGKSTSPASEFGSNAAAAWAAGKTGSASVYIGIIDEGIQYNHPDLSGQVWSNPKDPANGIDDDRNGYVDDVQGWDFANNDNTIYDGGTNGRQDDHGTHVSGTIGGKNNGTGVVGVNWNVTLISGKFLGRNGGTTANAVKAVDYFTALKNNGLNIVATNNSWGGGGYSQALFDAISRANNAGILFVAAAGNGGSDGVGDNNDAVASYPSNYDLPNVIAVAAIDKAGALARFSNYGELTVDIGAPGVGIYSSAAFNLLESYSGTSMATPHVTGAVALYASVKPGSTVAAIRNAILSSAVATGSLSGKTVTGGRLDVNAALSK